ncbi:hypothetical protein SAMN05421740_11385 [Parapedobacter koreensis]|uniref:Preprotein translocase subunit SecB n=1 Tax=Parapedobacter koreensis TaxID=332977 RepID=A0A1H7U506_9SPHI|nr:hypothetical protein SAMN05421740_11385 [Parapedobacter koreensis]
MDLAEFALVNQQYKFTPPDEDKIDVGALVDQYEIDIDFSINTQDNIRFQVYVAIGVNKNGALPGYAISSEGVGFFDFSKAADISKKEKGEFLQFSGISICINQMRGIIATLTSNGPFGKYLLPSIDVNDLLSEKLKAISKGGAKSPKASKTSPKK